jgi:hypothetical protein
MVKLILWIAANKEEGIMGVMITQIVPSSI